MSTSPAPVPSLLTCQVVDIDAQLHLRVNPPVPTQMNSKPPLPCFLLMFRHRLPVYFPPVLVFGVMFTANLRCTLEFCTSLPGQLTFKMNLTVTLCATIGTVIFPHTTLCDPVTIQLP